MSIRDTIKAATSRSGGTQGNVSDAHLRRHTKLTDQEKADLAADKKAEAEEKKAKRHGSSGR